MGESSKGTIRQTNTSPTMKTPAVRPGKRLISNHGESDLLFIAFACFVFFCCMSGLFYFVACAY